MKPQDVTILDQHANALTTPSGAGLASAELSGSQFELRSRVEKHFQRKLLSMFDRIVGPDKSVVSVSVDLDFDKIEKTEEIFDPDGAVVRSEERQKESTTAPAAPEGVAGISANLPTLAQPATASIGGPQRQTSSTITNFEISKTIAHIVKSPSTMKGISVSVVVDGTYKTVTDAEGATTKEYVARTDDEMEKYKRMVLAAIGSSTTSVAEIINVPLDATTAEWDRVAAAQAREARDLYYMIGRGVASVAILLAIFVMVRYIINRVAPERIIIAETAAVGARIDQLASEEAATVAEVKEMAEDRPDDLAALIKVWVKDED
jgi:flagellar M-ring protein FliF